MLCQFVDYFFVFLRNCHVVKKAGILIHPFFNLIFDIFREYIGGDTGKDLLIISRRCIIDAFEKRFNLNEIKTIIENWKGENVAKVRTTLSRYTDELLSFTPEEENELKLTGFFSGVEDVIEGYLGKENFKTLEIMILFFEQMDQITNV